MAARLVNVDRDTLLLLPPNMREWVPEGHLVHFILDAVGELDLSKARINERGSGSEQYPPSMMLGLLIYSYATGVFGSRQIERGTCENVAVRVLCGDTHPDHDTICAFRRDNAGLVADGFGQVLEMAARCGFLKVGGITVAIDGTKVLANASRHAAVSYGRAGEKMRQMDLEIAELLAKAEAADAAPLEDGLSIPGEIRRRAERKAQLARARAEMEARAHARARAEMADYQAKLAARENIRSGGRKPRGREPVAPREQPGPKDQYNFTDPESRIMKGGDGGFGQSYNAQAAVEVESRLIVGQRVSDAANDKEQLAPSLGAIEPAAGAVAEVLVDSGFLSESAVTAIEAAATVGTAPPPRVLAAIGRGGHGRTVPDLEKRDDPPEPQPAAPFLERMAHRVATRAGRARYKLRQHTVEPTFGTIKEAMGFRRFLLRGNKKVSTEWALVCLAYNFRRLHRLTVARMAQEAQN
ncbi:MAG TPA: IS1182 family transposase [Verrucomicrobiae bacterium]|nr:IS1182 family transposase [Verrucomicrobiae bacterium]